MSNLEDINSARMKLMEALGEKKEIYMKQMKLWFQMKQSKFQFDQEVRSLLDSNQISLHNKFMTQLFYKCVQSSRVSSAPSTMLSVNKHRPKIVAKRRSRQNNGGFQATDVHEYVDECPAPRPQDEPPRYATQELLVPDHEFIYMRLMLAAWEGGLSGAEDSAADLLVVAIQHFLKDIITAVISRRKGYQLKHGKFMYGLGTPVSNPWLRNTVNLVNNQQDESLLEVSETEENHLIPKARPPPSQILENIALKEACNNLEPSDTSCITPALCLEAFQVHRSSIYSNSVYSVNMERILAQIHHPSWEDLGE